MYRRDRIHTALLWGGGILAIGACIALIVFFVHILLLRNSYRAACLEINDAILSTPTAQCTISRGDTSCPADAATLNYYDSFLLADGVTVFNKKSEPATDKTIVLDIGGRQLLFTGTDQNTAVNLRWITDSGEKSYTVRADITSFAQLNAYYTNLLHRSES